jgi:hypothetical protein
MTTRGRGEESQARLAADREQRQYRELGNVVSDAAKMRLDFSFSRGISEARIKVVRYNK